MDTIMMSFLAIENDKFKIYTNFFQYSIDLDMVHIIMISYVNLKIQNFSCRKNIYKQLTFSAVR